MAALLNVPPCDPNKICSSNRVAISKDWGFKNISNLHSSCLPLFQQGQQLELTFQSLAKFLRKTPNISSAITWRLACGNAKKDIYTLTGLVDHTSDLQSCHLNCRKIAGFRFRCDPAAPTSHSPTAEHRPELVGLQRTNGWSLCRLAVNHTSVLFTVEQTQLETQLIPVMHKNRSITH